jgi:hypothetical protein
MSEYVARFFIGGIAVSLFAMTGDVLRPKSFAGLFGAAPSVALATLGLAVIHHDASYVSIQAKSMAWGALALICYSWAVCQVLMRLRWRALAATIACLALWIVVAFSLEWLSGAMS